MATVTGGLPQRPGSCRCRALLHQSGADHVVVSSDAAGQMLAISTIRPAAAKMIADLLDRGRSLDLFERPVGAAGLRTRPSWVIPYGSAVIRDQRPLDRS
jgi:voltage-gated potassium channel